MVVRCLVALALLAGTAVAGEADRSPPMPERATGWTLGMASTPMPDGRRFTGVLGLQRGIASPGALRIDAEYAFLYLLGTAEDGTESSRGLGHRLALVGRAPLALGRMSHIRLRFYAAIEAGITAELLHDSAVGRVCRPGGLAGIRIGEQLRAKGPSPSPWLDMYASVRVVATADGVGAGFVVGFDWGQ